jgi:hypothetical protein
VTVQNSTFSANRAEGGLGGAGSSVSLNGGAGQGRGGAIFTRNGTVNLSNVTVNGSTNADGAAVEGIGDGANVILDVQRSILSNSIGSNDCRVATINGGNVWHRFERGQPGGGE